MEIVIKFNFCQDITEKSCRLNERLRDIFTDYAKDKRLELDKLCFLCNGNVILNYDLILDQIATKLDKKNKIINILVDVSSAGTEVHPLIENIPHTQRENVNKNKFINSNQINFGNDKIINNSFNKNKSVSVNQENTLENFDVNNNEDNFDNNNFNQKEKFTINFKYNEIYHPIKCPRQATIEQLCSSFVELKKSNIKYFKFIYCNKDFYQFPNKTIGYFFKENKIKGEGITIYVEENKPCYCKHKDILFACGSILLGIILFLIIYFATKDKDKDNK